MPSKGTAERSLLALVVIVSGISSAQVLGNYASSNAIRCAWLAEAKTLARWGGEEFLALLPAHVGQRGADAGRAAVRTGAPSVAVE
jgi:3-oxoacyl-[acyl-carrier protein] reductase